MDPLTELQIRQYNDPEILEFFNANRVRFRLVGDHLFVIHARGREVPAGPGDWLLAGPDGAIEVAPGNDRYRAQRAVAEARQRRAERLSATSA